MRTFAVVAAMVLVSASAQAGQSRNLSVAGSDTRPIAAPLPPAPQLAEVPQPATTTPAPAAAAPAPVTPPSPPVPVAAAPETGAPPVATPATPTSTTPEAPKYVERPTVAPAATDAPKIDDTKPSKRAERRRHRGGYWTAGRIMGELQRYGVYW